MSVENKENSKAVEEISKDLEKTKVVDGTPPADVAAQEDDEPNQGVKSSNQNDNFIICPNNLI